MEKLHELVESGEFDVVVVDTPPTRNALDLLDAPRRLTRFLENRLFRALLLPTRMSLRAVGVGHPGPPAHPLQGGRGRDRPRCGGLLPGLRGHGGGVPHQGRRRARSSWPIPRTAYVLVTSARPDAVAEASFFAEKLAERHIAHRRPGGQPDPPPLRAGPRASPVRPSRARWPRWRRTWRPSTRWPGARRAPTPRWPQQVAPAPVGRIPLFGQDVHDLVGLRARGRRPLRLSGRPAGRRSSGYRTPPAVR